MENICRKRSKDDPESISFEAGIIFKVYVFMYLSNLYIQHGAQTQDSKIKSRTFLRLSQPGALRQGFLVALEAVPES